MNTRRFRMACIHARSHDKCAMRRSADAVSVVSLPVDVKPIAATITIVHCSSPQYAIPAVATSLVLIAGMCKPWGGHRCATGCCSLPSVAPCPMRPVQRRRHKARCLPSQALAPWWLLLLRRAHSKAVRACRFVTLRQPLRSVPDAGAYTAEGVLPLLCPTAG